MNKVVKKYAADFETTVFDGQEYTEVWSAAIVEIGAQEVKVFHSISDFFDEIFSDRVNKIIYFHNLKFDGSFIINYLIAGTNMKQAATYDENGNVISFVKDKEMKSGTFKYMISDLGQWYGIKIKKNNKF